MIGETLHHFYFHIFFIRNENDTIGITVILETKIYDR
jgi:hypothetical protein